MSQAETVRHGTSRTYAVLAWGIAALFEVSFVVSGGLGDLLRYGAHPLLLAAVAWAVFWQPAVRVGARTVTLVNVVVSVTIPYGAITEVTTRWGLGLRAGGKVYTSWSAPTQSLRRRRKSAADAEPDQAVRSGEARLHGDADSLAAAIRARVGQLHGAGGGGRGAGAGAGGGGGGGAIGAGANAGGGGGGGAIGAGANAGGGGGAIGAGGGGRGAGASAGGGHGPSGVTEVVNGRELMVVGAALALSAASVVLTG